MNNNINCIFNLFIVLTLGLQLHSNYNYSLVYEQSLITEPSLLPRSLLRNTRPLLIERSHLKKYQLKDTDYRADDESLTPEDQQLIYQMEPPHNVLSHDTITIQNYRLLEMRKFNVEIRNPSPKFKLCVTEIIMDIEEVKWHDSRGTLPLCIKQEQFNLFNFTLYVSALNPQFVRATIYFVVEIYDAAVLVEEKTYAKKVFATVIPNHLRLETMYFKNCPHNQHLVVKNYQFFQIGLRFESKKRLKTSEGHAIEDELKVAPTKYAKINLEGKSSQIIIHTTSIGQSRVFPSLLLKYFCEQPLTIDYTNIGVLVDERMVIEVPITLSNNCQENITLHNITLEATSGVVELEERPEKLAIITALAKSTPIALIKIHSSKSPQKRSVITITIGYKAKGEERTTQQNFIYGQIRNAISFGQKRYIDVTKQQKDSQTRMIESRFPIKNNFNFPIFLNKITIDESLFQVVWQSQRRKLIYPNHSIQQFQLLYTGSISLPLSSLKYLALLQFNGNLIVPIEIIIYDHTLQCLYQNVVYKCSDITAVQFGHLRDKEGKSKQIVIRNWNPQPQVLKLELPLQKIVHSGINTTLQVYKPGFGGEHEVRSTKDQLEISMKAYQFVLLNIEMKPLENATTAIFILNIQTSHENLSIELRVKAQNGTIALIPQLIRMSNVLTKQIQYLNLVSTYSQQYAIREVSTNLTGLSVHYNTHPIISQNQWVGMSIVYEPFFEQLNITNASWNTYDKQLQYLAFRSQKKYDDTKCGRVKLTTTTDLEVNSTFIIENNFPPTINGSVRSEQLEGVFQLEMIALKRKKRYNKKQQRHMSEIILTLTNTLQLPMKYKLYVLSQPKFRSVDNTLVELQKYTTNTLEEGYFCISEQLKRKWNIGPSTIAELFRLSGPSEQCKVDIQGTSIFIIDSQRNKITDIDNQTLLYLAKSYVNVCRICFRFLQKSYVHRLINSELPNKILHEDGWKLLTEFVKAQLNHLEELHIFQLDYLDFHSQVKQDFPKFCETYPNVMMFRFCHFLNFKIGTTIDPVSRKKQHPSLQKMYALYPGKTHSVTLQISHPPGRQSFQSFLVLANNITTFQTYRLTTHFEEPKLKVENIYADQKTLLTHSQIQAFTAEFAQSWTKKGTLKYFIPIVFGVVDYQQERRVITGSRIIQICNSGQVEINIAHIGIQEKESTCVHSELSLSGLNCQFQAGARWGRQELNKTVVQNDFFRLEPHQKYNITVHFNYHIEKQLVSSMYFPIEVEQIQKTIYLYDEKGYYFKLPIIFKIAEKELKQAILAQFSKNLRIPFISYLNLNIISIIVICMLILNIQNDSTAKTKPSRSNDIENIYSKLYRQKRLGKIVRESAYSDTDSSIGLRLIRKNVERPVHQISEDMLLSVKEVKQRQLKRFFNESEESEIGTLLGNHHLSLSNSMSYEHDDHDNKEPKLPHIGFEDDSVEDIRQISEHQKDSRSSDESEESQLPEGEEVNQSGDIDEDSWFDFNRENSLSIKSIIHEETVEQQENFYNVFRCQIGLKKADNNRLNHKNKRD